MTLEAFFALPLKDRRELFQNNRAKLVTLHKVMKRMHPDHDNNWTYYYDLNPFCMKCFLALI